MAQIETRISALRLDFQPLAQAWFEIVQGYVLPARFPGWKVRITETMRGLDRQAELQAQGASKLKVGLHQTGRAFDFALFDDRGVYITGDEKGGYTACGKVAEALGCESGAFLDHVQGLRPHSVHGQEPDGSRGAARGGAGYLSIPALVRKWGASILLGITLGGLAGSAAWWVFSVDQHVKWGNARSAQVDQQFAQVDAKTDWLIFVVAKLADRAGVAIPALPSGMGITPYVGGPALTFIGPPEPPAEPSMWGNAYADEPPPAEGVRRRPAPTGPSYFNAEDNR